MGMILCHFECKDSQNNKMLFLPNPDPNVDSVMEGMYRFLLPC